MVTGGPALEIIYTGLAVISLHNGGASNLSLPPHSGDGSSYFPCLIISPERELENIIFFGLKNNEEVPFFVSSVCITL